MPRDRAIRPSSTLGRAPNVWKIIPRKSLIALGVAVGFIGLPYLFINGEYERNTRPSPESSGKEIPAAIPLGIFCGAMLVEFGMRGNRPWRVDANFLKLRPHIRAGVEITPTLAKLDLPMLDSARISKKRTDPIENRGDLIAFIDYQLNGRSVGAMLLQNVASRRVVFPFDCKPFSSSDVQSRGLVIADNIRSMLRSIPLDESLTFRAGAWKYAEREELPISRDNQLSRLIRQWERNRIAAQSRLGLRLRRTLHCYATYTSKNLDGSQADNGLDKLWGSIRTFSSRAFGVVGSGPARVDGSKLIEFLRVAYRDGFLARESQIRHVGGIKANPLTCDELWQVEYSRHNSGSVPPLPYRIRVTPGAIDLIGPNGKPLPKGVSAPSIRSAIWRTGAPDMTPTDHVVLPNGKYVCGAVMDSKPLCDYKPDNLSDAILQLFYGTAILSGHDRPGQYGAPPFWDTEIVCQVTGIDQQFVVEQIAQLEEETNFFRAGELNKGEIKAVSNHRLESVGNDYSAILDGDLSVQVGWMALTYRDTLESAQLAVDRLSRLSTTNGYLTHERQYFPSLWEQTLPWKIASLCLGPWLGWERRKSDFASYAPIFCPLLGDWTEEQTGIEFQSEFGGSPMYVSHFPKENTCRILTLGQPGSGKSLLAVGSILQSYTLGIRSFVTDAMSGNVATYKPVCDALGGTFWDTADSTKVFNFMQGVDFRQFRHDPERLAQTQQILSAQWAATIPDLALAGRNDATLKADYQEVVASAIASWLTTPQIRSRYDSAYDAGFGCSGWEGMPTLIDFLEFLEIGIFPSIEQTSEREAVLTSLKSRLSAFLRKPVGRQISGATTIDTEAPLIVAGFSDINNKAEVDILPMLSSLLGMISASALSSDATNIEFDEASIFCRYDCAAITLGSWSQAGRKQGIKLGIYGQDLGSLERGVNSGAYLDNCSAVQVGRVKAKSADYLSQKMGIPRHLLALVDDNTEQIPMAESRRRWVVQADGQCWVGSYKPSFFQQAISNNGQAENKLRREFLDRYPGENLRAYVELAKYLKEQSIEKNPKQR